MTLIFTNNKNYNRVIIPFQFCNLSRYVNSIKYDAHAQNNRLQLAKQNVKTVSVMDDKNKVRILLYANKKIYKGQELLYNYNEFKDDFN